MNSEEAKNMIFHNRKKNLFWGSFLPHFFNQLFLPVTVSGVVLNLENHSKNEIRAAWKTFFLKHRNISRHGQKMSNSGTDSVMISWSPSRHGGERENQIDFGNKIFVFLSSWKIDAGCIYDGMQWACWSALKHVLPLAIEQNEVNANMIMVIICFDRELPYLSLRYARYRLGH